ncbi:MAG: Gfo/Idh/MocA family oxidoreductase [Lachnospiraceae bacterium]|nr:Gfo/Idh/MocA family oxidoreductase [Lachnospiraceae bacterium]MDO5551538.1 Gfo/Idh/MocA family oxidoreductase [Lachnospiraceae bacterium]
MKWGILATGTIANKFAKTIAALPQEEETLAAVGSRRLDTAQTFARTYHIPKAYGSYEDLCADPEVEAIYISTPNNLHYEHAKMCLNAGKHVLCEKPFTTNADDAQALYALAQEKGLFIMEAFWIRFLPVLKKMRQLIQSGEIGAVKHIRCDFGFLSSGARKDRKFNSSLGGGALLDIGIYNLGFVHMITGCPPTHFTSNVSINEYGTDDFSTITLEYPGGITAAVTTSIGMLMPREAVVFGTKGSIYLPDYQQAQTMTVRPYDGNSYEIAIPFEINGFEYQVREASRCVAANMTTSDILKPEDSLAVLQLMDDIRESWGMKFTFEMPQEG